jgi:hypothetical protein
MISSRLQLPGSRETRRFDLAPGWFHVTPNSKTGVVLPRIPSFLLCVPADNGPAPRSTTPAARAMGDTTYGSQIDR